MEMNNERNINDDVEGERGRHRDGSKSVANQRPTKTLFIINFDPIHTRVRDIEKHFEPYGNVLHVRIRRNFAFVQFETQEEATKALECTHMSKILDRVVSVEYALRDDDQDLLYEDQELERL
nr:serine/arginine-rich splicing factor RS31-like isoform X2 [Tanacetum cinerariifolium]